MSKDDEVLHGFKKWFWNDRYINDKIVYSKPVLCKGIDKMNNWFN